MKLLLNKEKFDTLSINEKRVAICKDVLERIELKLIKPHQGEFIINRYDLEDIDHTPQQAFNTKTCEPCAKGALFCSWVGNFNKVGWDWDEFYTSTYDLRESYYGYPQELKDIFGRMMLDNIEAAFEQALFCWHYDHRHDESTVHEGEKYALWFQDEEEETTPEYRLTKIMENIISNNGEFIV